MVSQGGGGWERPIWGATFSSEGKTRSSDAGSGLSGGGNTAVADGGGGGGLTFVRGIRGALKGKAGQHDGRGYRQSRGSKTFIHKQPTYYDKFYLSLLRTHDVCTLFCNS